MVRLAFTPGASQALSVWIRAWRKMGGCANSDEPSVMLPTNKSCFLCILLVVCIISIRNMDTTTR